MTDYSSKKQKRSHGTPLQKLRSVSNRVPSNHIEKTTIVREEPVVFQDVISRDLFSSKQRPTSWQYYSRVVALPFLRTGTDDSNNEPYLYTFDSLDVNEALVINHFSAQIMYRPYTEPPEVLRPGYFVTLDKISLPPVLDTIFGFVNVDARFEFNLFSSTSRLYEANVSSDAGGGFIVAVSNRDGFSTINDNVLHNGDSSTSLYVLDTGSVSVGFSAIDSYVAVPPNLFAYGFLPYDVSPDNLGLYAAPRIVFEIRGHKITKKEAERLKALVRSV